MTKEEKLKQVLLDMVREVYGDSVADNLDWAAKAVKHKRYLMSLAASGIWNEGYQCGDCFVEHMPHRPDCACAILLRELDPTWAKREQDAMAKQHDYALRINEMLNTQVVDVTLETQPSTNARVAALMIKYEVELLANQFVGVPTSVGRVHIGDFVLPLDTRTELVVRNVTIGKPGEEIVQEGPVI